MFEDRTVSLFGFRVTHQDGGSSARRGELRTRRGTVQTPVFMAVGTQGTVKGVTPAQLREAGVSMVLGNTYHLMLRPGAETMASLGGLHKFMAWDGPILTDSGGFQVFSLAKLTKKKEEGVHFQSHIDGSKHLLSPEKSMAVQAALGSDVAMAFDDCTPYPADKGATARSMHLTHRWAQRSLEAFQGEGQALFGIVQGGMYGDLRRESAETLTALPFDGFAVGGLSVGEPKHLMHEVLRHTAPLLPADKPRYLMGVGTPADLVNAVSAGVDMFDCVMPTRNARNGQAFTRTGTVVVKHAAHKTDPNPLDAACQCYCCRNFSRAYLNHLFRAKEMLVSTLVTIHNLHYYQDLMGEMRQAIENDQFHEFKATVLATYGENDINTPSEAMSCTS